VAAGRVGALADWAARNGTAAVAALVAAEALIGLAVLYRRTIVLGAAAGLLLALAIWVLGQDFGQLYTGQATDPNTAPLVVLMAVVLLAGGYRAKSSARPFRAGAAKCETEAVGQRPRLAA
jgi:hypothetical protein